MSALAAVALFTILIVSASPCAKETLCVVSLYIVAAPLAGMVMVRLVATLFFRTVTTRLPLAGCTLFVEKKRFWTVQALVTAIFANVVNNPGVYKAR